MDEEEAPVLFAEALRLSMSRYTSSLRQYRRYAIATFVPAVITFIMALGLISFGFLVAVYVTPIPALLLILGFYYSWKREKIKPEYKIRDIGRVEYPIALYREEGGRFIILDAGGAVTQQEYSFPAIRNTRRFGNSVVRVRNQVSSYRDLLEMGGSQQAETLKARADFDDVTVSGRIERIVEKPMDDLVGSMDDTNIERTQMRAPVIECDDPAVNEIELLASFAELISENQDLEILMNHGLCIEIPLKDLVKQAQNFRKWSREALEQDIMTLVKDVIVEFEEDFSEISHILTSIPALIEATVPYSVRLHEDFMYFHFCPKCRLSDLEMARRETDFRRWVNEKILGNALQDSDLVNPHVYGDADAIEKAKDRIEKAVTSGLPLADPVFPVMLANLRELTMDEMNNYRCEKCGFRGDGIKVPRSIHPLASAYLLNLREQTKHIQEKADVIIRNVHDVIMNKESKLVSLGPYEQSLQQAEQNKLEVKGDLDAASEVRNVVETFERKNKGYD
ncbi:MAG: hypothetical protein R6V83_04225 [Candidatus Thorarchaeota archaeon]